MILLEVLLFLLLCALALGWASRRLGLPYPIALVVGGGLLGFIPRLPQLDFDPQFLLVLVLPPILYQAALLTSWRDFKANLRTIPLLALRHVLSRRREHRVRADFRRRHRDRHAAGRPVRPAAPLPRRPVHRSVAVAVGALHGLRAGRIGGRLRRAGGGRRRAAARTLLA